jgi:hypothetical protein
MTTKTVYQTNPQGLYVGPAEADESPLEPGVFMIPAGCVESPPPVHIPELKAACWNGKAWQLVDYFEGLVVYSMTTCEPLTLTGTGAIPDGYTTLRPGPDQVWKNGRWVDDLNAQLAKIHAAKTNAVNTGCADLIVSGFTSNALGEPHRYQSTLEDQVNLTGVVMSGLPSPWPCFDLAEEAPEKIFREHSAAQLLQLGLHLVVFKQKAVQLADALKKALNQALADKDLAAMKAIEWHAPQ